ncbi:MAG: hypothetical protein GXX79_04790 [Actinomycetales bacterium]|nr:hypothetical protein [Actinomycetales bacterium]
MVSDDIAATYRRLVARCSGAVVAGFLPASGARGGTVPAPVTRQVRLPTCVLVVTPTTVETQRERLRREAAASNGVRRNNGFSEDTTAVLTTRDCLAALRDPALARWCRHLAWDGRAGTRGAPTVGIALLRAVLGPAVVFTGRDFLAGLAETATAVVRTASAGSGTEGRARLAVALDLPEHVLGPLGAPPRYPDAGPHQSEPGGRPYERQARLRR